MAPTSTSARASPQATQSDAPIAPSFKHIINPAPEAGSRPKVVLLSGPTGVGKTAASLELAKLLDAEIISADSVQVYRGLDVGSDKIPLAERRGIVHHLIDVRDPWEDYSAGQFFEEARAITEDILARGKVPLVVGGTSFYLKLFISGKPDTPKHDPKAAAAASDMLEKAWAAAAEAAGRGLHDDEKWAAGLDCLAAAGDPDAAEAIRRERNNYRRLTRALQVLLSTGRLRQDMALDDARPLAYDFRAFCLTRPRIECARRVGRRAEQLLQGGLLAEAAWLLDLGVTPEVVLPAARAIGYRQAMEYLVARRAAGHAGSPQDVRQLVLDVSAATRKLGRSQLSWFRDNELYAWVDATREPATVAEDIAESVRQPEHVTGREHHDSGRLSKAELNAQRRYVQQLEVFHEDSACLELMATIGLPLESVGRTGQ